MKSIERRSLLLAFLALLVSGAMVRGQVYLNYSVSQPAALTADAGLDLLICPGDLPTIGGNPAATGGYNGYSYQWMPGAMVNNALAPNPIATVSQTTVFILSLSDSMGCTAVDTTVVTVDTCIGIVQGSGVAVLDVYPNPNQGRFTVKADFTEDFDFAMLQVVDLEGRKIFEKRISGPIRSFREQVKLDGFSRGAYFVHLKVGESMVTRKIVLQ